MVAVMRKSFNDREKITIFAGDLSYFVNEQALADFFSQSGFHVLSVKIGKSRAGDSLQYGFVQVPASTASAALDTLNGQKFMGRRIRLSFAGTEDVNGQRQLWVQVHISFTCFSTHFQLNEEFLDQLFSRFGEVADTTIKQYTIHKRPPKQYGYGFVYFYDAESALRAIEHLNAQEVDGVQVECELSYQSREQLFNDNHSSTMSEIAAESPIFVMPSPYNMHAMPGAGLHQPPSSMMIPMMHPPPPPSLASFEQPHPGFYPAMSPPFQYIPSPPPGMHIPPGMWMQSSPPPAPAYLHQPMVMQQPNQVNMIPMFNMAHMPVMYGPSLQAVSSEQYFPYQPSIPIQQRPWHTFHQAEQQQQQQAAPQTLTRPWRSAPDLYQVTSSHSPRQATIDRRSSPRTSGKPPRAILARLEQKVQSFDSELERVGAGQSQSTELDFVVLPSVSIDLSASMRSTDGIAAASPAPDASSTSNNTH